MTKKNILTIVIVSIIAADMLYLGVRYFTNDENDIINKPADEIRQVLESNNVATEDKAKFILKNASRINSTHAKEVVQLHQSASPIAKRAAIAASGYLQGDEFDQIIKEGLKSVDASVKLQAIEAIGTRKDNVRIAHLNDQMTQLNKFEKIKAREALLKVTDGEELNHNILVLIGINNKDSIKPLFLYTSKRSEVIAVANKVLAGNNQMGLMPLALRYLYANDESFTFSKYYEIFNIKDNELYQAIYDVLVSQCPDTLSEVQMRFFEATEDPILNNVSCANK